MLTREMFAPAGKAISLTPKPLQYLQLIQSNEVAIAHLGLGKYGLRLPISWKILELLTLPVIGSAVSNGFGA